MIFRKNTQLEGNPKEALKRLCMVWGITIMREREETNEGDTTPFLIPPLPFEHPKYQYCRSFLKLGYTLEGNHTHSPKNVRLARKMANDIKGTNWTKNFYRKYIKPVYRIKVDGKDKDIDPLYVFRLVAAKTDAKGPGEKRPSFESHEQDIREKSRDDDFFGLFGMRR